MSERYTSLKLKVDEQDFKVGTLSRNFESVKNNLSFTQNGISQSNMGYDKASHLLNVVEIETEVKLLRGQLIDERTKREQSYYEQH